MFKTYDFVGELYPFQEKGAEFLYRVPRCLLTDKTGLGKTVQCIAAYDAMRQDHKDFGIIVCTLASTQLQWQLEFERFLPSAKVKAVIGTAAQRKRYYVAFAKGEIDGLIINYSQVIRDIKMKDKKGWDFVPTPLSLGSKKRKFVLVSDEIQKCKRVSTKTSKCVKLLADQAQSVKGLTATPIHTNLIDIYGIFKVIEPRVFKNKATFVKNFCIMDYTWTPYGTISGYKNHQTLKNRIKNITLGRNKAEVAAQLPPLMTKDYYVNLPKDHQKFYDEIDNRVDGVPEDERKAIVKILVESQVCVNAIENVEGYTGKPSHPKLDEALRLVTEDLSGEKVLIYSRFKKTVDILEGLLYNEKVPVFKVTGDLDQQKRQDNMDAWRSEEGTSVLLITGAGGAGLNLQAASTLIMIDRPWSIGELDQIRGRIHRLGSKHTNLLEINLIVKNTIDEYVLESLKKKQKDNVKVFGQGDSPVTIQSLLEARKCLHR